MNELQIDDYVVRKMGFGVESNRGMLLYLDNRLNFEMRAEEKERN